MLFLLIFATSLTTTSCGNATAQSPQGAPAPSTTTSAQTTALLSGEYTYWSTGQYWGGGQDGSTALPPGIPTDESKDLFDSGTFDADGQGNATQCGGGSWGTWSTALNCVTWIYQLGVSDNPGVSLSPRLGLIKSNVGDKATLACTATGKHCVMTSHGVGWAWTQVLDRE